MKIFLLLGILIFTSACSGIKVLNRDVVHENSGVVIDENQSINTSDKNNADTDQKPAIINEETVRIGENGGEVFNNSNIGTVTNDEAKDTVRNLRVGVAFGPGLTRAITYVEVLKEFERQNIQIHLITGNEFGAIVSALYANGITPEMIEWMFFKYFKEKKNYHPYSSDWIEEVDEFFLEKLRNVKIEDLKTKFYLTLYDHNLKKAFFFNKGNVRDLILLSLRTTDNALKFKDGKTYSGTFEKEVFNVRLMKSVGSDFTIAVDSLTGRLSVSSDNKEVLDILKSTSLKAHREKNGFDIVMNIPAQDIKLDSGIESANLIQQSNNYTKKQTQIIKKKIKNRIEFLNSNNSLRE